MRDQSAAAPVGDGDQVVVIEGGKQRLDFEASEPQHARIIDPERSQNGRLTRRSRDRDETRVVDAGDLPVADGDGAVVSIHEQDFVAGLNWAGEGTGNGLIR